MIICFQDAARIKKLKIKCSYTQQGSGHTLTWQPALLASTVCPGVPCLAITPLGYGGFFYSRGRREGSRKLTSPAFPFATRD